MRKLLYLLCAIGWGPFAAGGDFLFLYDNGKRVWSLNNSVVSATFELNASNQFGLTSFALTNGGRKWEADPARISSPIRFTFDKTAYNGNTKWTLVSQWLVCEESASCTQNILLRDTNKTVQVQVQLFLYAGQPVLRHSIAVTSLKANPGFVTVADMLPYTFADPQTLAYRMFRVNQWAVVPRQLDFETFQTTLATTGSPVTVNSGSHGVHCGWFALRDSNNGGLFAGWEFDGLTNASARQFATGNYLQFSASIADLHRPLANGQTFNVPSAFIGLYQGDWDEAGYRTQRFVETVLAKPVQDNRFPYVGWDSWGYGLDLDENVLRQEALRAAQLGVELFVVDLGWAPRLGDWTHDPTKFPSGLRALSDYVHSFKMKFGLHFAFAEADPGSQVIRDNPDWTSTENDNYFGGLSLCLSHKPVRDWVIAQAIRIIDDYDVDWILQDGENMVKRCTKMTHTHDPGDSNYSNAVEGVNAVVAEIQRQRPNVLWENCENGGNMMTFNMVKNYTTSITNDASGALGSRQAVFGATYPFPPRFTDRYQPEGFVNTYVTRSYMFGGPWHLMNRLTAMSQDEFLFALSEIQVYKSIRATIRDGYVFHLTPPGQARSVDAIQSYEAEIDTGVAILSRGPADPSQTLLKLRGLDPEKTYRVSFQDESHVYSMTGAQLMDSGITVHLPRALTGEVVYVEPDGAPSMKSRKAHGTAGKR